MEDNNNTDNDENNDNERWRSDCKYSIEKSEKNFPTNNVI